MKYLIKNRTLDIPYDAIYMEAERVYGKSIIVGYFRENGEPIISTTPVSRVMNEAQFKQYIGGDDAVVVEEGDENCADKINAEQRKKKNSPPPEGRELTKNEELVKKLEDDNIEVWNFMNLEFTNAGEYVKPAKPPKGKGAKGVTALSNESVVTESEQAFKALASTDLIPAGKIEEVLSEVLASYAPENMQVIMTAFEKAIAGAAAVAGRTNSPVAEAVEDEDFDNPSNGLENDPSDDINTALDNGSISEEEPIIGQTAMELKSRGDFKSPEVAGVDLTNPSFEGNESATRKVYVLVFNGDKVSAIKETDFVSSEVVEKNINLIVKTSSGEKRKLSNAVVNGEPERVSIKDGSIYYFKVI